MLTVIDKTNKLNGDKIENLSPNNLKKGITVLGVTGTLDANIPQEKIITPKTEGGIFVPDEGYTSFSKAYIEEVNEKTDPNFKIGNIKSGVSILGQEGTLSTVPKNYQNKKVSINTNGTYDITVDGEYDAIKRLEMIVAVPTGGGTPENTVTGDGNISSLDVVEGEKIYSQGEEIIGTLPKKTGKENITDPNAIVITNTPEGQVIDLNIEHKADVFRAKESSIGYSMSYGEAIDKFEVTADKIMTGNKILGVEGTAVEVDPSQLVETSDFKEIYKDGTYRFSAPKGKFFSRFTYSVSVPKEIEPYENVDIIDISTIGIENEEYIRSDFGYNRDREGIQPYALINIDLKKIDPYDMEMSFVFSQNFDGIFNPERYGGYGVKYNHGDCKLLFIGPKMFDSQPIRKVKDLEQFNYNSENCFIPFKSDGTPLLDTSEVTNMQSMFFPGDLRTTNLKRIPLLNTSNVTNMTKTFEGNGNLLEIAPLDTSKVISMNSTFKNCKKLKVIPDFNLEKVEIMDFTFSGCSSLKEISYLKTPKLYSAIGLFEDCEQLSEVEGLYLKNCLTLDGMFKNCKSLQRAPVMVAPYAESVNNLFEGCENLMSIDYLNAQFDSAKSARYLCKNCHKITTLFFNSMELPNVEDFGYAFEKCYSLEEVPNNGGILNGTRISTGKYLDYTFLDCIKLKSCKAVNYNNLQNARGMFYNCPQLTEVKDITPGLGHSSNLSDIREIFLGCVSLENLPDISFGTGVKAEKAFENCPKLNDNSLNKILQWGIENDGMRRLSYMGLSAEQIARCKNLSNWQAFVEAGGVED